MDSKGFLRNLKYFVGKWYPYFKEQMFTRNIYLNKSMEYEFTCFLRTKTYLTYMTSFLFFVLESVGC